VTDECIHGFPIELCDICSPRQRDPETIIKAPTPRRSRVTTSLRSTAKVAGGKTPDPVLPATRDFGALRAHHVTHIENLPSILAEGAILAADQAAPVVDVSSASAREARAEATAPDGSSVAGHVPFTLSPDARRWDELRSGAEEDRWSDAARRARATEFVVLVVPTTAFGASVILTDTDAEDPDVRFAVGPEAATNLLRRTDITDPSMHGVELLAGPRVPLSAVALVGVPNDRVRQQVKEVFAALDGPAPRVAVFPPWFVPPLPED
jgi:hypothetical protein